jgi:hypothetical protein
MAERYRLAGKAVGLDRLEKNVEDLRSALLLMRPFQHRCQVGRTVASFADTLLRFHRRRRPPVFLAEQNDGSSLFLGACERAELMHSEATAGIGVKGRSLGSPA